MPDTLPEGTDRIVNDSAAAVSSAADTVKTETADLREKASAKAEELKAQAGDKARSYAEQGKDRATGALDEVARLIGENAAQIDDKLGTQYGAYARKAAEAVEGFSGQLREKDVDELIDDARELVRRSPAIALSAAAAAGFLIARVVKSGSDALESASARAEAASPAKSPRSPKPKSAA